MGRSASRERNVVWTAYTLFVPVPLDEIEKAYWGIGRIFLMFGTLYLSILAGTLFLNLFRRVRSHAAFRFLSFFLLPLGAGLVAWPKRNTPQISGLWLSCSDSISA